MFMTAKKMKKEKKVKGFLDEVRRSEGYTADYFMDRYGNKMPWLFVPFTLLILAVFSLAFITVPPECTWAGNVSTVIDIGILMGSLIIGSFLFYEAFNNFSVILNAVIFFITKAINEKDHDFDRKTVLGLLVLLGLGIIYLVVGVVAAKLIGDNAGKAIACYGN